MNRKFKKTLEEKYGRDGKKGYLGEVFFINYYQNKGYKIIHNDDDILLQSQGTDVIIENNNKQYTIDIKNNLTDDGYIVVEISTGGWLFNSKKKSNFISHVNHITKKIVTYRRNIMKKYINHNFKHSVKEFIYLPVSELSFTKIEIGT